MKKIVKFDFWLGDKVRVNKEGSPHNGRVGVIQGIVISQKNNTPAVCYNLGIYMDDVKKYMYYTAKFLILVEEQCINETTCQVLGWRW